jgi:phosphate transport system ATP-binding protein
MLTTATLDLPSRHSVARDDQGLAAEPTSLVEKMSARHLGFHYEDGNHALRDVSLPIYRNRVTALIGPSGCGKSTLLRVFNRIYEIHHRQRVDGEVLLDGKSIFAPSVDVIELRRRVHGVPKAHAFPDVDL